MVEAKLGLAVVAGTMALFAFAACGDDAPSNAPDAGAITADAASDAALDAPGSGLLSDAELSPLTGEYRTDCAEASPDAGAPYPFTGFEPSAPGKYPVFVYTVGTWFGKNGGGYDAPASILQVREMARRGFVAVSVAYENGDVPFSCDAVDKKALCVFADVPSSAMRAICSRPSAACEKGVVVAGESQGAMLALRSQNHYVADGIKGVWGRSVVDAAEIGLRDCMSTGGTGTRRLPNARLWATNGADDTTPGTDLGTLQRVTGWPEDGVTHRDADAEKGGYFQVQTSDLQPGHTNGADHDFHFYPDIKTKPADFDDNWAPPSTTPWSLNARLDWLSSLVQH